MNLLLRVFLFGFLMLVAAPAARSENRLALVIGNASYQSPQLSTLRTPHNDMQLMADVLRRRLSYQVYGGRDMPLEEMRSSIELFIERVRESGRNTTALVYYSGHGMEVDDENYLFPVDAIGPFTASNTPKKAISLTWLLNELSGSGAAVNVLILDACRNDATKGGTSKGLMAVANPPGTIIAFATAPGHVASDRPIESTGASYYTHVLAKTLAIENLSAFEVLSSVRDEVFRLTQGEQTPWERINLSGRPFAFNPILPLTELPAPAVSPSQQACERHVGHFEVANVADWDHLNIRREPRLPRQGERSNVVVKVGSGTRGLDVRTSTCSNDGWCEVQYLCSKGYANLGFLRKMEASPETGAMVAPGPAIFGSYRVHRVPANEPLNVREDPNARSPVIVEIPYNAQNVLVHDCRSSGSDRWCFVTYEGRQGWANSEYLRDASTGLPPPG